MKIYTKTGDAGETSLFSGGRVGKDNARIEAYGTIDELSAFLGLLRCEDLPGDVSAVLGAVQNSLFEIGGVLADSAARMEITPGAWDAAALEAWIDTMETALEPLRAFILSGGTRAAALAHVSRTVCRRAERRVITLRKAGADIPEGLLPYLNRLSDALFTLARYVNAEAGVAETEWPAKASS